MSGEAAQRLTAYCRDRVGDSLRSVVEYGETEYELVYLRDDLQSQYSDDQFDDLVGEARAVHNRVWAVGTQAGPLGAARATVHYFENAFVIQLVPERRHGYFATFNSNVGQTLGSFIHDCLQRVHTETTDD
jgi:hypothetical protein